MKLEVDKTFFIISLFSIHLIPFAYYFSFETMPFLIVLFSLIVFIKSKEDINNLLKKNYTIILLIFFLTYGFLFDLLTGDFNIIEFIKYLIGPIIFFFFSKIRKFFDLNYIIFFIFFIFLLYIVLKFQIPFLFNFSCFILEFFIARMDCGSENISVPFLITPEPSYLSLMLCFCLLLILYLKKKDNNKIKLILICELLLSIIIFESKSRIGLVFISIYIFFNLIKLAKKYYFIFFILIIISFFYLVFNEKKLIGTGYSNNLSYQVIGERNFIFGSRSILNIDKIINTFHDKNNTSNLLEIISNKEPTGFIRILHNYLSLMAFYTNPWGHGIGSYARNWYNHAQQNNLVGILKKNEISKEWFNSEILSKKQYVQNYFFSILYDFGLIPSIIFLIILGKSCLNALQKRGFLYYMMLLYLFICFFWQSPITSPYPWIIMAILYYNDKKNIA